MNIEEKARAYDEALERCKEWASGTCGHSVADSPKDIAEFIFQQLAESEDEKIREFLIGILSQGTWRKEWPFSPNEVVAYLERQNHVQSDTEKEYVRTLKSLIFNFLQGKQDVDTDYYQRIEDWLDKRHIEQKEQNPTSFNEPYNPDDYEVVIEGNATSLKRKEQESTNVLEDAFKYYTDRGITISCGDFKAEPKKEQKSTEWSEEDERILKGIIGLIDHDQHYGVSNNEMISWLNSLRPQHRAKTNDYITPHKEFFEWIYNRLINVHNENPNVDYMQSFKKRIDNLQFDEPHWKPSEEQMEALNYAIAEWDGGKRLTGLYALRNDLKKLI